MKRIITTLSVLTIVVSVVAQNNGFNFNKTNNYNKNKEFKPRILGEKLTQAEDGKTYLEDELFSGIAFNFSEDGQLTTQAEYVDGRINGLAKIYLNIAINDPLFYNKDLKKKYFATPMMFEGYYKDGNPIGQYKGYYENGQIFSVTNYKDGKRVGFIIYHRNRQVAQKGIFKDGEIIFEKCWGENGKRFYPIRP